MTKPKATGRKRLAMQPADYTLKPGETPPDYSRVVYIPGKGMVPHIPYDPDLPSFRTANGWAPTNGKLANGLSPRADAFARLVARGVSGSDAMRAVWPISAKSTHKDTAHRAARVMSLARGQVNQYRQELERERQQKTIPLRDFVLSRLTLEAQTAPESASRIKALELLGKSEAMWTTVLRQETAVNPDQLAGLKTQLEQRLSMALSKLGARRITDIMENRDGAPDALGTGPDPHPEGSPPSVSGSLADTGDTNQLAPTPVSPEDPVLVPSSDGTHTVIPSRGYSGRPRG